MDDKKTTKLSTRVSIFVVIVFVVSIAIVIVAVNFYMRRQALFEAESKAMEILDSRLAIHTYFSHQIKPKMFQFTEHFRPKDYFEPTWMSSTYAIREMGKYADQMGSKEYYYKECAINARSPENEADGYEREFLKKLAEKPDLVSQSNIRYLDDKPYFAVLRRGEAMEESCLRCHSDPQIAPKGLVDIYGSERSFNRKVGDVVQAISIRIPLSTAYASANHFSLELSGLLLVLFVLLYLSHYYVIKKWLFDPIDTLREKAFLIAHKKEHLGEKIDIPKGRELKELAVAFNAMTENLREHTDHLEDMVKNRTQQIKESEKRFRLLFENTPLGYQSLDENGNFIEVNQEWLDLFGYRREEVIGRSFGDFAHPDWQSHFKENFPRFKSIGEILGIEFEMVKKDGTLFTVSINGKISKNAKGHFLRTHCILTDVTERKKAQEKLKALSTRQEAILSAVPDIIMEVDNNKTYTWANPAGLDFFGDDVIGREASDYFEGEQETYSIVQPIFNGDEGVIYVESWQRRKDGQKRLLAWWCRVLKDASGKTGALSTARDITDQKQAEESLIRVAQEWQSTFDSTNDAIWILDKDQRVVRSNKTAERYFKSPIDQMIGKHCWEIVHGTEQPIPECPTLRTRKNLQREKMALKIGEGWFDITVDPILNEAGQFDGAVHTVADITERKQAEIVLQESEEKFRNFTEQSFVGFYIIQDGLFKYVNPKFADIFGYTVDECLDNMHFRQLVYPEDLATVEEQVRRRLAGETKAVQYAFRGIKKTGEIIHVTIYGSSLLYKGKPAAIGTMLDITKNLEFEKRILQSQRMEAIGTLAGGIAHDFNNILSAIIGYTELAQMKLESDSEIKNDLKEVLTAGVRAKDLVKQILTFSRQAKEEQSPVQMSLIAKEALKLLRSTLPSTIDVRQSIQSQSVILSDPTQLHQILMNLCTNAAHAMREQGGILEITLTDVELDSDFCSSHPEILPGAYQKLTVSDSGHGMTHEVMRRVFDPFFTTKETGEGTGLGLSVVHGIVKDCGGTITVYSEPDKGTTFNFYFPIIECKTEEKPGEYNIIPTGSERILMVDDEKTIIDLSKKNLTSLGYAVEVRNSSIEALELFKTMPDKFDLVITDMTMPQMTGDKLAQELIKIRPDIPIVLCTGFSEKMTKEKAETIGIKAFLMKPLLKEEMAHTIRKVLDKAKSSAQR